MWGEPHQHRLAPGRRRSASPSRNRYSGWCRSDPAWQTLLLSRIAVPEITEAGAPAPSLAGQLLHARLHARFQYLGHLILEHFDRFGAGIRLPC